MDLENSKELNKNKKRKEDAAEFVAKLI